MVNSSCLKENFTPIEQKSENEWYIRFSPHFEYYPVYDEQGNPTGETEESGFVVYTEELIYGELTPDAVRHVRLNELRFYDESSAVNEFYVNDIPMWYNNMERVSIDYLLHVEKSQGNETTDLYDKEGNRFTIDIDLAIALIAQVELYAKAAYNVTVQHKLALNNLDNIDDLLSYNIKTGYPEKLHLHTNE